MFYAKNANFISNSWTHLDPQRVFAGQYWDEFGLMAHLLPDKAEVLMLGLAGGGGVRPLFSTQKNISLTAVDLDLPAVHACKTQYKEHFPDLPFQAVVADAKEFLKDSQKRFDGIWLDIYPPDSYSPLYWDDEFYTLILEHLKPDGVLLANSYGLPNHFAPLQLEGVQSKFAAKLSQKFKYIKSLPYRRNITFIAKNRPIDLQISLPHSDLHRTDATNVKLQALRILKMNAVSIPPSFITKGITAEDLSFDTIKIQMAKEWSRVVTEISRLGFSITKPTQIFELIDQPSIAQSLLTQAFKDSDLVMLCLPIFCAGEAHLRPLQLDWLCDWFLENSEALRLNRPDLYYAVWLPQIWSLMLHPTDKISKYEENLTHLIHRNLHEELDRY